MSNGGNPFTRDMYDAILDAFREVPGNYAQASRLAGVSPATAKRAWLTGWRQYPWARPVQTVLREEAQVARSRRREQKLAEQAKRSADEEQAAEESAKATTQETTLVVAARANALLLVGSINRIFRAATPLAARLEAGLLAAYDTGKISDLQLLRAFKDMAVLARHSGEAARMALELHRIQQNRPIHVIGIEAMDPEVAAMEMEALSRTLRRAEALGIAEAALEATGDGPTRH